MFVMAETARQPDMATFGGTKAGHPRRVFNNIFLHGERLPAFAGPSAAGNVVEDGNLYWASGVEAKVAAAFFNKFRASDLFAQSKKLYPPGSSTHSQVADPRFKAATDYRLQEGSPAVDAGVELPKEWPDPVLKADKGKPDRGALPLGAEPLRVGRNTR